MGETSGKQADRAASVGPDRASGARCLPPIPPRTRLAYGFPPNDAPVVTEPKPPASESARADNAPPNFIFDIVQDDLRSEKNALRLHTRFPPEPNGFLHIGHAKAICVNFSVAGSAAFGKCNLRLDDTNPVAEDDEYVQSIQEDVRWLGFDWEDRLFFASDYFEKLYASAVLLIERGLAYVDSQTPEQIRETRGNFYTPGQNSPYRERSVPENLDLFAKMRAGELKEGEAVLRAKIDMAHSNMNMRDPLLYRIRFAHHHRTGDAWCIYPMYDYAHPLSDAFEGITHSLCSLEFENHRPLYDWCIEKVGGFDPVPRQIEFARLNLTYTVLSKRKLQQLVKENHVSGWDDPRMPTIAGMRRRGYLAASLVAFCERIGVAKRDNLVDVSLLEHQIRDDLNADANRTMAVLRPLKVTIENMAEGESHQFEVPLHPEYPERGVRSVTLTRSLFVERDDYLEDAPKQWFRLGPGREVRLRGACFITCQRAIRDASGDVVELVCTWDPASKGGNAPDGRKVKGTIHWLSEADSETATVRLYDRLFSEEDPEGHEGKSFLDFMNPGSLETLETARIHRQLATAPVGTRVQFERLGYFCRDPDSSAQGSVWNRTIGLKDSWAKIAGK
jgi:glutaminyl-tRNA synthetase